MLQANTVLGEIKNRFALDESVFAALISGQTKSKKFEATQEILDTMNVMKLEPGAATFIELFENYILSGRTSDANSLLKEKLSIFDADQLTRALQVLLESQSATVETLSLVLKKFSPDIINNHELAPVFRNICSKLVLAEKYEAIETLLKLLPTPKFQANEDHDIYGSTILQEMVGQNSKHIIQMSKVLSESGKNARALHIALGFALKQGSSITFDLMEALSSKEPLRAHYFWPSLLQSSLTDGEMGVLDMLKLMTKFKVEADFETISVYVLPKLGITMKNSEKGVKQLEEVGIKTSVLFTPLISQLLFQQRYNEILYLTSVYPTKIDTEVFIHPLVVAFSTQKGNPKFLPLFAKLLKALGDKASNNQHDLAGHVMVELISNYKTKDDYYGLANLMRELKLQDIKLSKMAIDVSQQHLSKVFGKDKQKFEYTDMINKQISVPTTDTLEGHIKHPR